ncbi:hypothetical protein ACOME3_008841 [Neoechinorhynchus agilis]
MTVNPVASPQRNRQHSSSRPATQSRIALSQSNAGSNSNKQRDIRSASNADLSVCHRERVMNLIRNFESSHLTSTNDAATTTGFTSNTQMTSTTKCAMSKISPFNGTEYNGCVKRVFDADPKNPRRLDQSPMIVKQSHALVPARTRTKNDSVSQNLLWSTISENNKRPFQKLTLDDILLETSQSDFDKAQSVYGEIDQASDLASKNDVKSKPLSSSHFAAISSPCSSSSTTNTSSDETNSSSIALPFNSKCYLLRIVEKKLNNEDIPRFARPTQSWLRHQAEKSHPHSEDVTVYCSRQRSMSWVNIVKPTSSLSSTWMQNPKQCKNLLLNKSSMYWFSNPNIEEHSGQYFVEKRWRESLRKPEIDPTSKQLESIYTTKSPSSSLIKYANTISSETTKAPKPFVTCNSCQYSSQPPNKAVSLECVAFRTPREGVPQRIGNVAQKRRSPKPSEYRRSSRLQTPQLTRYSTLDTVCEEKVMNVPHWVAQCNRQQQPKQRLSTGSSSLTSTKVSHVLLSRAGKIVDSDDRKTIDYNYSMNRYFSEVNLLDQCRSLGALGTCSDHLVFKEQMPLKYKRDSWLRRYGRICMFPTIYPCIIPCDMRWEPHRSSFTACAHLPKLFVH